MFEFHFAATPTIVFGAGTLKKLPDLLIERNFRTLTVLTGGKSFRDSDSWNTLVDALAKLDVSMRDYTVRGEPSPERVDEISGELRSNPPDCVLSIGGGSVIDAGKAVSAMIRHEGSVEEYLEGVGSKTPKGNKVFFIALPTTSGTGSEATKNAVISRPGKGGFKKSLRHDAFVPDIALIDPELTVSCPADITAASGMDAVTQLLEGFVSTNASPITDSLAMGGIMSAGAAFPRAVEQGENDLEARTHMAYAAMLSGTVLANAGLGVVHGIAGYIGGLYPSAPHGAVCGTLLAKATDIIIEKLFDREEENNIPLLKYAEAGKYLTGRDFGSVEDNCKSLVDRFYLWTEKYDLPRLSSFGITVEGCRDIAAGSGRKNTPVPLTDDDCFEICTHRL